MNVVPIVEQSAPDLPTGFDAFYLLYPKHVEKRDAQKVWDRLTPAEQDAAIEAIVLWRKVWAKQGQDIQYLPSPRRWLHGARWQDEAPTDIAPQQISASHVPFAPTKPVTKAGYSPEVAAALRAALGKRT